MVPFGMPEAGVPITPLCRQGYLAGHDNARHEPAWVAERLTAASAWACGSRIDAFKADPDLPASAAAKPADYAHSGFDIGHMANAANHLGAVQEQRETFYLSNMLPQQHLLNAGLWFKLEVMVRVWAWTRHDIIVLSGPVYHEGAPTIGANKLPVPAGFYKIIMDPATGETLAFLVPHQPLTWTEDPARYVVPLGTVAAATGIVFARPPGSVVRVEPTTPWPADLHLVETIRTTACAH